MANAQRFLPSQNPYGSGVLLDSSPYTQYHLAQRAKEQAKDEALDKYFNNIDSKINPAGMRTQEIGALLQQQNDDRNFYLKNKEAIKKPIIDNGKAYNEYMARNQSKLAFIENSKKKGEIYKQMVPIFADPTKRALMGDEALAAIEAHDLPMTDPRHQEFDITKLNYNPKPFEEVKYRAGLNPFVKEVAGETSFVPLPDADPKNPQFLRKPVTKMLQNYDKMQIANFAENEYKQNPSYRSLIKQIEANPTQYDRYNKIYKQNFGNDLDISHPEQIAVAHTLEMMPKGYTKEGKPELDTVEWEKYKNKRNFGQSIVKINLNKETPIVAQGNLLDTFGGVDSLKSKKGIKTENGVWSDKDNNPYTGEIFTPKDQVNSTIYSALKAIGIDDKKLARNKGFTVIIKDGRVAGMKDPEIGLIDRQMIENAQLKLNTEPQKGKQMQFGNNNQSQQPSGYSQVTETNKGQIGVKNGKWYYTKTGKAVQ